MMAPAIRICEVGLRDGLQGEVKQPSLSEKTEIAKSLTRLGLNYLEIGSFVNPKAVPAMSETDLLVEQVLPHISQSLLTGLVLNEQGLLRAIESGVHGICVVAVISESLSRRNSNCTVSESLLRTATLIKKARERDMFTRVDIAPAWVCPYEGIVSESLLYSMIENIVELQPDEIVLADTIGHASPAAVKSVFSYLLKNYPDVNFGAHFHDTQALGLTNAYAALEAGVRLFDTSFGGLGGCPFAPGAKGNLATEDLVLLADKLGLSTGIDLDALFDVVIESGFFMDRQLGGRVKDWWHSRKK